MTAHLHEPAVRDILADRVFAEIVADADTFVYQDEHPASSGGAPTRYAATLTPDGRLLDTARPPAPLPELLGVNRARVTA